MLKNRIVFEVELFITPLNVTLHRVPFGNPVSKNVVTFWLMLFGACIGAICSGITRSISIGNVNATNAKMSFCMVKLSY